MTSGGVPLGTLSASRVCVSRARLTYKTLFLHTLPSDLLHQAHFNGSKWSPQGCFPKYSDDLIRIHIIVTKKTITITLETSRVSNQYTNAAPLTTLEGEQSIGPDLGDTWIAHDRKRPEWRVYEYVY